MNTSKLFMVFLLLPILANKAASQPSAREVFPEGASPLSTNINKSSYPLLMPDNSVIFRMRAPMADNVQIDLSGRTYKMEQDNGFWSVRTAPQVPGFHYYSLLIDGFSVADPASESFFGTSRMSSAIDIPEEEAEFIKVANVPHGQVSSVWYYSNLTGTWREMFVYTPPRYNDNRKKFPVVYIQHGGGEDHRGWVQQGRAGTILDNLAASKMAVPMILVSANSNLPAKNGGTGGYSWEGMQSFREELLESIIPFIEKNYRVKKGRDNRALCGLSMGGGHSFYIGLRSPETFSKVGVFSTGLFGGISEASTLDLETEIPGIFSKTEEFNKLFDLFFIACGEQDPRIEHTLKIVSHMHENGVNVHFESYPGGHEWQVWRKSFYNFAQNIFKK